MKKFLAKISDIKNAMRVLEIMDRCGCDIEEVDGMNYYRIRPKYYVSRTDAEDLRKIISYKEHYCKRSRIWNIIFPDVRDGCRFL